MLSYQVKNHYWEGWKNGEKPIADFIRQCTVENIRNENLANAKQNSPCIGFGQTPGVKTNTANQDELDVIAIDLDHLPSDWFEKYWTKLCGLDWILLAYKSWSGGVRVLVHTDGNLKNKENYHATLLSALYRLKDELNFDFFSRSNETDGPYLDMGKTYGNSIFFLGRDLEHIYYNPDAKFIPLKAVEKKAPKTAEIIDLEKFMDSRELKAKDRKELQALLDKLSKKRYFNEYDEWLKLGMGLKNSGFAVSDWQKLSFNDDETQALCDKKWNTFQDEYTGKPITLGSLIHYAREEDPDFLRDKIIDTDFDSSDEKYSNDDGSMIALSPKGMFYKTENEWIKIQTSHLLKPLYCYDNDCEKDRIFIYECENLATGIKTLLKLKRTNFEKADKLQVAFQSQNISILIDKYNANTLFSYSLTHCQNIDRLEVGMNNNDIFVDAKFAVYKGNVFKFTEANPIIEIEGKKYYVESMPNDRWIKTDRIPKENADYKGIFTEYSNTLIKAYKDPLFVKLFIGWQLMGLLRNRLLNDFNAFPIFALEGERYSGKTVLLDLCEKIFNIKRICQPTIYQIFNQQKYMQNSFVLMDEFSNYEDKDNMKVFLKEAITNIDRMRNRNGVEIDTIFRNSLLFTTNSTTIDEALSSRFIQIKMNTSNGIRTEYAGELQDYVQQNADEILMYFLYLYDSIINDYEKVITLIKSLKEGIDKYSPYLGRISLLWSIILVGVNYLGFSIDSNLTYEYILSLYKKSPSERNNVADFIFAIIDWGENCCEKPDYISDFKAGVKTLYIPQIEFLRLLKDLNFIQNPTIASASMMLEKNSTILKKRRTTHTYKNGQREKTNFIIIDLSGELFTELFDNKTEVPKAEPAPKPQNNSTLKEGTVEEPEF